MYRTHIHGRRIQQRTGIDTLSVIRNIDSNGGGGGGGSNGGANRDTTQSVLIQTKSSLIVIVCNLIIVLNHYDSIGLSVFFSPTLYSIFGTTCD